MKRSTKIVKKTAVVLWWIATALIFLSIVRILSAKAKGEVPYFFGYAVMNIVSGSMGDTIPEGSYILIEKTDPSEIRKGDIICFYSDDPAIRGYPNTHTVIEDPIQGENGLEFVTKGDANPTKDDLSYECYAFPIPRANWAELNFTKSENGGYNFSGDFALYETVLRICGRTMLRSTASLSQVDIKFAEMATTRAMKAREVYDSGIVSTRRAYGATLTEAERLAIERAK